MRGKLNDSLSSEVKREGGDLKEFEHLKFISVCCFSKFSRRFEFSVFWRKVFEFGCSVSSMVRGGMSGCCLCEEEESRES